MNKTKTIAILGAILVIAALAVAAVAVTPMQAAFATYKKSYNNQQNYQAALKFNFNNQQDKSN